jgi:uncharacterized surface protein with fasciclin (FAS1) repeats
MRRKFLTLCAGLTVVAFAAMSRADDDKPAADIVDTAVANKDLSTLVTAIKAAGLVETLREKGPFTVFAPTNAAFAKLGKEKIEALLADKEKLKKILLAHVVVGKDVTAADVVAMEGKEVNGFLIKVDGKRVSLGDANVTKTDIKATNGVIHLIDTVLIPKE